jgi:hypothetical protein
MEKDGWLDQALYAVLNFLNQTWLGITVALVGAFAVAFLAKRSPGTDWEYIKDGPDKLLAGVFLLLAGLKTTPRFVLPTTHIACDTSVDPTTGLPVTGDCRFVTEGTATFVYDYTLGDMVRDFLISLAYSGVAALLGGAAGYLAAVALAKPSGPAPSATPPLPRPP